MQKRCNSRASAMKLHFFSINPSKWFYDHFITLPSLYWKPVPRISPWLSMVALMSSLSQLSLNPWLCWVVVHDPPIHFRSGSAYFGQHLCCVFIDQPDWSRDIAHTLEIDWFRTEKSWQLVTLLSLKKQNQNWVKLFYLTFCLNFWNLKLLCHMIIFFSYTVMTIMCLKNTLLIDISWLTHLF